MTRTMYTTVNILNGWDGAYLFSIDLRVIIGTDGLPFVRLPGIATNSGYRAFDPETNGAMVIFDEANSIWIAASRHPAVYNPTVSRAIEAQDRRALLEALSKAEAERDALLEALEDAEDWLDIAQSIPETGPRMGAAHDRAREALSKAKGATS